MKNTIKTSIGLLLLLLLSSCDNNPYYENAQPSEYEGFGKTYLYVEQYPVSGLEYECTDLDRERTDENGGFSYLSGTSCRFYLNEREIFVISASKLQDGKIYDITDTTISDQLYAADTHTDPNKIVITN